MHTNNRKEGFSIFIPALIFWIIFGTIFSAYPIAGIIYGDTSIVLMLVALSWVLMPFTMIFFFFKRSLVWFFFADLLVWFLSTGYTYYLIITSIHEA